MALNVSAWSIRRPIVSVVIFFVLSILGLVSFQNLPITRFPNIDVPIVSVTVTQSGAAPVELETQVTKKIEDAAAGVSLVKHINSNITDGASSTLIEFRLEANTDRAVNDVKDAVSRIRADPPRAVGEPIIRRVEVEGAAILSYAVSAPNKSVEEVSWFIDDAVMRQLQSVRGVAGIDRSGGIDREIRVDRPGPAECARHYSR
jgi:hydrophobic/amphiphilic exporter-1 (mainly G- bacteria), HAE1 family